MARPFVLDSTLGAAFIGVIVATALYGGQNFLKSFYRITTTLHLVSAAQAWHYFHHQRDNWPIKLMVITILIFDTTHQCLITHTVYVYVITNWGNPAYLEQIIWSMLVEVLFNGLTALVVQSFLAIRLWRFCGRKIVVAGFIGLLVLAEFSCVLVFTSMSLHMTTYVELAKLKYLSILVNALAAAGDLTIAAGLCINLHLARTGFSRSNTMINMLILFSINTGALTSLCALASLISIVCAGDTFLYISFFFCIGRLYTNSLLATLNARDMIRSAGNAIHATSCDPTPFVSLQTFPTASPRRMTSISISLDTSQCEDVPKKTEVLISTSTAQDFRSVEHI